MAKKEKSIYELKLHEEIWNKGNIGIKRVPGGWLYMFLEPSTDIIITSTFVPFNNEFQLSNPAKEIQKQNKEDIALTKVRCKDCGHVDFCKSKIKTLRHLIHCPDYNDNLPF